MIDNHDQLAADTGRYNLANARFGGESFVYDM